MNYKLINEALQDIDILRSGRKFTKVSAASQENGEHEGSYTDTVEVYALGEDDVYIKVVLRSDSYGENTALISIQLVKPVVKQITDFETI